MLRRGVVVAIIATAGVNTWLLWGAGRPTLGVLIGGLFPLAALLDLWLVLRDPDTTVETLALHSLVCLLAILAGFTLILEGLAPID